MISENSFRFAQRKDLQKVSFWFALLLHLLLLLLLSFLWTHQVKPVFEKNDASYIPSFAYQEPPPSSAANHRSKQPVKTPIEKPIKHEVPTPKKPIVTSEHGIEKPVVFPKQVAFNEMVDISSPKNAEPVHLIGDKNNTPKPLIIILAKALTAKLLYPKAAIDLTIKGVSVIGFMLHPDGTVSDVRLLKSSSADVLDQAALLAAREISPVKKVAEYVQEPTPIVFGIIFGSR